jgi:hypothetical protein
VEYVLDVTGAMANYELDEPLVVTYSATGLPSQLVLDPATGIITGTLPPANPDQWWVTTPTSYTFKVTATVEPGQTINTVVSQEFTINQATLTELPTINSARVGEAFYSDAIRVASSIPFDVEGITYQLDPGLNWMGVWVIRPASNPLPDGLVMNPDGTITGIPTVEADNVEIIVLVRAPGFVDSFITRSISVLPAREGTILFSDLLLDAGKVGNAYSAVISASGADEITFSSSNVPAGLVLNPNGTITGTPTVAGTFMFDVVASAADLDNAYASVAITIQEADVVIPPVIAFEDAFLVLGKVGDLYSAVLSASGADDISFASSDLPAGLVLDPDGTISGTPTEAGTYMFTVTASATGATSSEASIVISIQDEDEIILPVISFNDVKLVDGQVGSAYNASLTASGASGITFASANLPAGLTLNANGTISGTPTEAGVYMFTVTASADGAQSTEASIIISVQEAAVVVLPEITFNNVMLVAGQVGSAYNASLTASGASGITFAATNLPAGLTLNANGTISGTPTASGTFMFTVTASVTGAQSAEASVVIRVEAAAEVELPQITFSNVLLTAGKVGDAYTASLSASGATGITFAATGLPAGLTLSADGTLSGTPTEAGTYLITVTASATGAQSAEAAIVVHVAQEVATTGCSSALSISTIVMSLLTAMAAGVFILIRKRH